jgi:hypothetical protein
VTFRRLPARAVTELQQEPPLRESGHSVDVTACLRSRGHGSGQCVAGKVLVAGQVLIQGPGSDLGVALAELAGQLLVCVAPPVVLTTVRVEQPETDPHVPFGRSLVHGQDADVPGRGGRRKQCEVKRAVVRGTRIS